MGYVYKKVRDVFCEKVIIALPTILFAEYNAAACLDLLIKEMENQKSSLEEKAVKKILQPKFSKSSILTIALKQFDDRVELPWIVYEDGKIHYEETVILYHVFQGRRKLKIEAFTDIIDTVKVHYPKRLDAIAIGFIGSIENGLISLPNTAFDQMNMKEHLQERYQIPVVVMNNVNAAVLGWYSQQDRYKNIVFHSQSRGLLVGGQGIVLNGHLYEGKGSLAGEVRYFYRNIHSEQIHTYDGQYHPIRDPGRLIELLAKIFSMDIGILAPEVICVRCDMTPDMEEIRQEVLKYIPEKAMPEFVYIQNFEEYVFIGLYIEVIKMLEKKLM